jgi:hypothetical protein
MRAGYRGRVAYYKIQGTARVFTLTRYMYAILIIVPSRLLVGYTRFYNSNSTMHKAIM